MQYILTEKEYTTLKENHRLMPDDILLVKKENISRTQDHKMVTELFINVKFVIGEITTSVFLNKELVELFHRLINES